VALLIYRETGGRYVDFLVPTKPFTVGRSAEADVSINDERISRIHCAIHREGGHFVIRDLDSKNGTWVNDVQIHESPLKFGDNIRVGHTVLAFDS